MYHVFFQDKWLKFPDYAYLVNWISQFNREDIFRKKYNYFLDNVGVNYNDTLYSGWEATYLRRVFRVENEYGVSIYDSILINDVKDHTFSWEIEIKRREIVETKKKSKNVNARSPGRKMRGTIGDMFKRPRTYSEMKVTTSPEMKEFTRGKRGKNLPTVYDDYFRENSRSWKDQRRYRKQWEHRIAIRSKASYIDTSRKVRRIHGSKRIYDVSTGDAD